MTAPADYRTIAADRRFDAQMEEFEFMLSYGITAEEAARRAGTKLGALRSAAERRGLTLPTSRNPDTIEP